MKLKVQDMTFKICDMTLVVADGSVDLLGGLDFLRKRFLNGFVEHPGPVLGSEIFCYGIVLMNSCLD
jgi:hypothetical protein